MKNKIFIFLGDVGFPKLKTIDVAQLLQTKSVYVSGMVWGGNLASIQTTKWKRTSFTWSTFNLYMHIHTCICAQWHIHNEVKPKCEGKVRSKGKVKTLSG